MPNRVLARFTVRLGEDFATPEALKKYLHDHPQADKSKHRVVKHDAPEAKKDEPTQKSEPEKKDEPAKSPEKIEKSLFKPEELKGLGTLIVQSEKDPDKLFEQAKKAHEEQLDWLNRGKGLDKALGAKVIRGDEGVSVKDALKEATDKPGPIIVIGPTKKQSRSKDKVDSDYGGDWSKLGDIVRATIAVDSMDQIEDVMTKLRASGLKLARQPKDRFAKPTAAGYRDLMMNVEYPNGHVGEIQVHLKPILKAKAEGHALYDQVRKIEEAAKKEGRTTLTDDEEKAIEEANSKQTALYDKAWKAATGEKAKPEEKTAATRVLRRYAQATKYFDYEGIPAKWESHKFPQKVTIKGEKTVYELYDFFRLAQPIDEAEFKRLKEEMDSKMKKD